MKHTMSLCMLLPCRTTLTSLFFSHPGIVLRILRSFCLIVTITYIWALPQTAVLAAGPTGEEESLADLMQARYPLAVSADGKWRVHVDGKGVIHRVAIGDKKLGEDTLRIPGQRPQGLSLSRTGEVLAMITDTYCLGIVRFPAKGTVASGSVGKIRLHWITLPERNWGSGQSLCPVEGIRKQDNSAVTESEAVQGFIPGDREYAYSSPSALAISEDGKRVALEWDTLRILDISSKRMLSDIPNRLPLAWSHLGGSQSAGQILHLRFLDNGRKLLVVQTRMGEGWESEATGSDMHFAVWDLSAKELINYYHTNAMSSLQSYDLLWGYADETGELWVNDTHGEYWEAEDKRAAIRPFMINLKQCQPKVERQLTLPPDEWIDFTTDPKGRWIAVVDARFDEKTKQQKSRLILRSSRDGKVLAQWNLGSEVRSLTASADGFALYAVTSGQPLAEGLQYTRVGWNFRGGGAVTSFDLRKALKGLAPMPSKKWGGACPIEDEIPNAREINVVGRKHQLLFDAPLPSWDETYSEQQNPRVVCHDDNHGYFPGPTWGLDKQGQLWVDKKSSLEQWRLTDGRVERRIPTPRSSAVCATPVYARQQFLTWQGDTVALRPFAETIKPKEAQVLLRKPGWFAQRAVWLGTQVGVYWIDKRYLKSGASHEEGSALAISYDVVTGKPVAQTDGFISNGVAYFPDGYGGDTEEVFGSMDEVDSDTTTADGTARYQWNVDYAGSIRARRGIGTEKQTVLWDGLRFPAIPTGMDIGQLIGLGGSMAAYIQSDRVTLYDAAIRRRYDGLMISGVRWVGWNGKQRILLTDTRKVSSDYLEEPRIRAHRIDD